jgi:hypothetical protein
VGSKKLPVQFLKNNDEAAEAGPISDKAMHREPEEALTRTRQLQLEKHPAAKRNAVTAVLNATS